MGRKGRKESEQEKELEEKSRRRSSISCMIPGKFGGTVSGAGRRRLDWRRWKHR